MRAGQAQKEFFVNQALATIDGLLQLAIDGSLDQPPASPVEGACFRILGAATGEWAGKDDMLALLIAGTWQYVTPSLGARIYDRSNHQVLLFDGGWIAASEPASPAGGSVIDAEARTAIDELIQALRNAGIFAN